MIPETRYAKTSDGIHIAYQVLGDGPIDLVYVGPWVTHIEYRWELPQYASYLRRDGIVLEANHVRQARLRDV